MKMKDLWKPSMLEKELINMFSLTLICTMRKIEEGIIIIYLNIFPSVVMMEITLVQGLLESTQEYAYHHPDNHNHIMKVMLRSLPKIS